MVLKAEILIFCYHHRTHLQDLIETTAQIHYEAFRSKQLLALKETAKESAPRTAPPA